jgi:hypothetical protein
LDGCAGVDLGDLAAAGTPLFGCHDRQRNSTPNRENSMIRTKLAGAAVVCALAAPAAVAAGSGDARAVTIAQRCGQLTGTATINPGLQNTPADQVVRATGQARNCTPSAATGGSGRLTATFNVPQGSCAGLVNGTRFSGTGKVTWANGAVSNLRINAATTSSDATLATISGKVLSGKFVNKNIGGKIRFTPVFTGTGAPCSPTNPLKKLTFTNKISDSQTVPFRIFTP